MPQRLISSRRWPARNAATSACSGGGALALTVASSAAAWSAVTRGMTRGASSPRSTVTTGAAQHMPLQPPATTRAGSLRRRDLVAQRAQRVGGADREAAGAGADDQGERGRAPHRGEGDRAACPRRGEGDEGNPRPRRGRGQGEGARRAGASTAAASTRPRCSPSTSTTGAIAQSNAQSSRSSVTAPSGVVAPAGDAEAPLAGGQHVEPAPDAAREPHADAHHAAARLGQPELGIVRGDAIHLAARHAEMIRRLLQRRGREPAIAVLERVQRGEQPGPLAREAGQDVGRLGHGGRGELSRPRARDRAGRPRRSPCAGAGRSRRRRRPGRRAGARSRTR